ncbi:MAG: hypothetical protein ACRC7N_05000 [Clostridium sp.]
MYKKILLVLLIAILVSGNVYLYNKMENLDYSIIIGTPYGSSNVVERTDFSKPLSDRDEVNEIIFTLMSGDSIVKPDVCKKLPDSTIWVNDWDIGATYFVVNIWVDGDDIIIESGINSVSPSYKKVTGDRATTLKSIMQKYKINALN